MDPTSCVLPHSVVLEDLTFLTVPPRYITTAARQYQKVFSFSMEKENTFWYCRAAVVMYRGGTVRNVRSSRTTLWGNTQLVGSITPLTVRRKVRRRLWPSRA